MAVATITALDCSYNLWLYPKMEFEWNETKRLANIRDHKVDFMDAAQLFDGRPTFTYYSPRNDEDRWGTVGEMDDGKLYLAVWTQRNGRTRLIAAYRADDWEIRAYRALHGGTA